VTALPPEVRRAAEPVGVGGFEVGYVTDDGLDVSFGGRCAAPWGEENLHACAGRVRGWCLLCRRIGRVDAIAVRLAF
jgi:hypothetical protein